MLLNSLTSILAYKFSLHMETASKVWRRVGSINAFPFTRVLQCLQNICAMFNHYYSWVGFRQSHIMKERLRVYAFLRNDLVIEKDMYVILHVP